jgi:hypothetical protein
VHPQKKAWLAINVVGGVAVLGSYAHGIATHENPAQMLWGTTPAELQAVYDITMLLAAAGYFVFSYYFAFCTDADNVSVGPYGFGLISALYALVLVPSALWMPLTFAYFDAPSSALWVTIRLDLFAVGVGAVGLLVALFTMRPRPQGLASVLALLGLLLFALQTAFLDAIVWPQFIPGT